MLLCRLFFKLLRGNSIKDDAERSCLQKCCAEASDNTEEAVELNRQSLLYTFLKKIENPSGNNFFEILNRFFNAGLAIMGGRVYYGIKKKYPERLLIVNPATSSGDMIFLSRMFKRLIKLSGTDKYLLILDNAEAYSSAAELRYENLYPVSRLRLKALFVFYRLNLDKLTDIVNCYPWVMFDYKNADYSETKALSSFKNKEYCEELFAAKKLIQGKTVILSPYEQSISAHRLPRLKASFWEELANRLISLGYTVCTNCAETQAEPVIKGTRAIFPKLRDVAEVTEYAGIIVAVRSGIVDYISGTGALKVILYPTKEYYNTWNIARTCDAYKYSEIIYEEFTEEYDSLVNRIIGIIKAPKELDI